MELRCPDDGFCHHGCHHGGYGPRRTLLPCFRLQFCLPLSGVFDNDEWPEMTMKFGELLNKCRQEGHQWRPKPGRTPQGFRSDVCAHCGTVREGDKYIFPADILSVFLPDDLPTLEEARAIRAEVEATFRKKGK